MRAGGARRTRSSRCAAAGDDQRRAGEYQRYILSGVRELLQLLQRHVWIAEGDDPIVVGVPLDKLRLDVIEGVPILVDGEHDRKGHLARNPNAVDAP